MDLKEKKSFKQPFSQNRFKEIDVKENKLKTDQTRIASAKNRLRKKHFEVNSI